MKGISTFRRFIYLNTYAFLLLFLGVGILLIPLWQYGWLAFSPQLLIAGYTLKSSVQLFGSWCDKKRKYVVLMQKNTPELRPDTFNEFMHAPCGRLLTRVVLRDLGHPQQFKVIKSAQPPLSEQLKKACTKQKTVVYIADDHSDN